MPKKEPRPAVEHITAIQSLVGKRKNPDFSWNHVMLDHAPARREWGPIFARAQIGVLAETFVANLLKQCGLKSAGFGHDS